MSFLSYVRRSILAFAASCFFRFLLSRDRSFLAVFAASSRALILRFVTRTQITILYVPAVRQRRTYTRILSCSLTYDGIFVIVTVDDTNEDRARVYFFRSTMGTPCK